jgi:hypothetical protein
MCASACPCAISHAFGTLSETLGVFRHGPTRSPRFESRSARLKLAVRKKPYAGPSLANGVTLLYRRNRVNGTFIVKVLGFFSADEELGTLRRTEEIFLCFCSVLFA